MSKYGNTIRRKNKKLQEANTASKKAKGKEMSLTVENDFSAKDIK